MTTKETFFFWAGVILLALAVFSGATLLFRAAMGHKDPGKGVGMDTLWGLFIICGIAGMIITACITLS